MQIILLERIEKLGQMGDLVNVKTGYARNFLIPQGKALRATKANTERFEAERAQREANNLELRKDAEAEADRMKGLAVSMVPVLGGSRSWSEFRSLSCDALPLRDAKARVPREVPVHGRVVRRRCGLEKLGECHSGARARSPGPKKAESV